MSEQLPAPLATVCRAADDGSSPVPVAAISRASSSTPARNVGNDTGSCTNPCSPLTSQTRFATLPGSIATTNVSAGSASRSKLNTSKPPFMKKEGTQRRPPDESAAQTSSVPISGGRQ